MAQLNDLQLILLSAAAARDDGSLLPVPNGLADQIQRVHQTIPHLMKQGLVTETPANGPDKVWREQGDERIALVITDAGLAAINAGDGQNGCGTPVAAASNVPAPAKLGTKASLVLELLGRTEGASLDELTSATGWLPHTTRAALTGLRKKGHALERQKVDGVTRYVLAREMAV